AGSRPQFHRSQRRETALQPRRDHPPGADRVRRGHRRRREDADRRLEPCGGERGRMKKPADAQLLHLVFGGELESLDEIRFADLNSLDIVGIYPNYRTAYDAWKAKAQ